MSLERAIWMIVCTLRKYGATCRFATSASSFSICAATAGGAPAGRWRRAAPHVGRGVAPRGQREPLAESLLQLAERGRGPAAWRHRRRERRERAARGGRIGVGQARNPMVFPQRVSRNAAAGRTGQAGAMLLAGGEGAGCVSARTPPDAHSRRPARVVPLP